MEKLTQEQLIAKWYEHGLSVHRHYNDLIKDPQIIGDEKIIEWFREYKPLDGIAAYHINHDISKPYIIEYDEQGRAHYPNHWISSNKMFIERYGNSIFAEMILHDMDFHTAKGEELDRTWALPYSDHLYATAWAAIFANAELFGGVDSDSFKIKRKKLLKAFKYRPSASSL